MCGDGYRENSESHKLLQPTPKNAARFLIPSLSARLNRGVRRRIETTVFRGHGSKTRS